MKPQPVVKRERMEKRLLRWREELGSDFYLVALVQEKRISWVQLRPVAATSEDLSDTDNFFIGNEVDEDGEDAPLPTPSGNSSKKGRGKEELAYVG